MDLRADGFATLTVTDLASGAGHPALRLYAPEGSGAEVTCLVVYAHGGGFTWGTLDDYDRLARNLAQATGGVVASVDYRLAPAYPFPAALDDVVAAILWVAAEHERLAPPRVPLIVAGDSAGGCLAAAATQRLKVEGRPIPDGQLLVYPMIEHHERTPAGFFGLARTYRPSHDDIRGAWDQYLTAPATPETSFAVPGAVTDLRGLPPALVLTAAQDPLRVEAEAYADRMAEAGIAVRCRCFAEVGHSFLGKPPGTAGVDAALAEIQAWVMGLARKASAG